MVYGVASITVGMANYVRVLPKALLKGHSLVIVKQDGWSINLSATGRPALMALGRGTGVAMQAGSKYAKAPRGTLFGSTTAGQHVELSVLTGEWRFRNRRKCSLLPYGNCPRQRGWVRCRRAGPGDWLRQPGGKAPRGGLLPGFASPP